MKAEISTAAGFITRLLRSPGGIGDEQLRCFGDCLQEALRGEAQPGPAAALGGLARPRGACRAARKCERAIHRRPVRCAGAGRQGPAR